MELATELAPLGFGFMRLPEIEREDGSKEIDIEAVKGLVDAFMASGFTYFDTARGYHGCKSEGALRQALVERYPRESFTVATKLPAWMAKSADEARAMFDESLRECGVEYFDYYLLHNLGEHLTDMFEDMDLWNFALQKKEEGLIRHFGFSFHDNADALAEVLRRHPEVDFVQLQINYVDWDSENVQSRRCYEVAREFGKPVVVMEPVKGGSLVRLPRTVGDVLREADPAQPLASWALRFAASLPGVITVLSGMNDLVQVQENVRCLSGGKVLSQDELACVMHARDVLASLPGVPCTDCRYCLKGCPAGVRIPTIMQSLNILDQIGDEYRAKENYFWNAGNSASKCIACGACEEVCPQKLPIIENLARAAELFE